MSAAADSRTGPTLAEARRGSRAVIAHIEHSGQDDRIAQRLEALGFVSGEPLRVVATGAFGAEPIVVQIGTTRFALRRGEARRVRLRAPGEVAAATFPPDGLVDEQQT
ncbi:MAG: FeoA family protein [Burkholderiaceae bacterium]